MADGQILQFPKPSACRVGGQAPSRKERTSLSSRRHYGGESQNSKLFVAFGVFGSRNLFVELLAVAIRPCPELLGVAQIFAAASLSEYHCSMKLKPASKRRSRAFRAHSRSRVMHASACEVESA